MRGKRTATWVAGAAVALAPLAVGEGASARSTEGVMSADALVRTVFTLLPEFATVRDSASLESPVVLHGALRNGAGAGLTGAQVLLSAWPSNEAVRALPIGGRIALTPIARTIAGVDGGYVLRSALTPRLSTLVGSDGLDLQLDVFHAGRHFVHLTQVVPDRSLGGWVRASAVDPLAKALSVGAHRRNLLDVVLNPADGNRLGVQVAAADKPPRFRRVAAPGCTNFQKIDVQRAMTTVATAAARNGVSIETVYTREARTETSTGVSMNGGATFAMSGSRTRTSGIDAGFKKQTAPRDGSINRDFRVRWLHTILKRECARDFQGAYDTTIVTSPDRVTGGGKAYRSDQPMWTCPRYNPKGGNTEIAGYDWASTDDHHAKTVSGAFGFEPVKGASFVGNAQSGYSENVKVTFRFSEDKTGYFCGDTSFPADDNQRVQAFQK